MDVIVVLELRKQKEIIPVILPLVNEESELFQLLIDSLHLSVSLGVICHGGR